MIRINQSQLDSWHCKERWRQRFLLGYHSTKPPIHYVFGSVVHILTARYWDGVDYQEAFNEALRYGLEHMDIRLLPAKQVSRWNEMLDALPAIATVYWGFHGDDWKKTPAIFNEQFVEWQHSNNVTCYGTIDRLVTGGILQDTKTTSAYDRNWKQAIRWENIRRPQLSFYLRYCAQADIPVERIQVEAIVKPYRGSEPEVVILDITKEVMAQQERFVQQMDWAIREIEHYATNMREVSPWPMNTSLCVGKYSECDYLPVCDLKVEPGDSKLYQIEEER
jgi:PD-(D/E)XK nuclease superfamily